MYVGEGVRKAALPQACGVHCKGGQEGRFGFYSFLLEGFPKTGGLGSIAFFLRASQKQGDVGVAWRQESLGKF